MRGSAAAGARAVKGIVSELTEAMSFALARFEVGKVWAEVPAVISGLVLLCCGLCARGLGGVRPGEVAGDAAESCVDAFGMLSAALLADEVPAVISGLVLLCCGLCARGLGGVRPGGVAGDAAGLSVDPCGMLSSALLTDEPVTAPLAGSAAFLLFLFFLVSATLCSSSPVSWMSGGGGAVGRAVKLGVAFSSFGFLAGVLTFDTLLSTKPPGGANRLTAGNGSATGRDERDHFDAADGDAELS